MTVRHTLAAVVAAGSLLASTSVFAAVKTYQVTGPVLEVNDKTVVVQKGDEKWEIELGSDVKIEGKLKVGEKVTIFYHMVADKVEKKGK